MTDLERINKVINDLFDIMDTARSNFGEEGYNALDKARQAVTDAWNVCKKGQERKGITNSCKPIKSSLEDRLLNLLEEFEEGYADTINRDVQEGSNGAYEEAFIEGFKNDYNLTNEDIEKLRESVHEIWNASSEEGEVRDMGEMYGVPRAASSEEALKHFE